MSNTTEATILSPSDKLLGMSGDGNLISYVERRPAALKGAT